MGKLMVGVMCILPLCAVVLVLPAIAVAQPAAPSGLYVNTSDSYGLLLGWLHNSFDESGFEITDGETVREVGAQTTGYRWGTMKPGQYKCFRIRAYQDVPTSDGGTTRSYSDWEPNVTPWYRCGTTFTNIPPGTTVWHDNPIYAGYGYTGVSAPAAFIQVSARWGVPRVECPSVLEEPSAWQHSRAAPWVGVSGDLYHLSTAWLIQTGTISNCAYGEVSYEAVWAVIAPSETGASSKQLPFKVASGEEFQVEPNDEISAGVNYDGSTGSFNFWITNFSKGISASHQEWVLGATAQNSRSWALCIVESAPASALLSQGGMAKFTTPIEMLTCSVFEGHPNAEHVLHQFEISKSSDGKPLDTPKAVAHPMDLSGGFTIEWQDW
jgi:hypothetical protein